jgi:DNA end-binding protein Ku
VVPRGEIVKGYQFQKDRYVTFTGDELKALEAESNRSIDIEEFVPLAKVDPIYFENAHYLGPDKGAEKAYALLVEAMNQERKVAVARFVLRNKEHLAAIRPMGNVLTMATMRFADEVVAPEELDDVIPEDGRKLTKRELEMAEQLIESLSTDFDADKYRDEYREELVALIERKARGEEVVEAVSEAPKPTKAPDLMAALEESLAAIQGEPLAAGSKRDGKGDGAKRRKRATAAKSRSGSKSSKAGSRSRSKAKAAK